MEYDETEYQPHPPPYKVIYHNFSAEDIQVSIL